MPGLIRNPIVLIGILLAIIIGVAVILVAGNEDEKQSKVVTTKVDTLDKSPDKDKAIKVPAEAAKEAADALSGKVVPQPFGPDAEDADHTGLKDETPKGVPEALIEDNKESLQQNKKVTKSLPTAGASGGVPGCRTQFVRNQSSRRGVRPTVQVLHYTVSPNRPGWSDVNGITAFFNRSSSQASSTFVIDAEGHCAYIVPIESKPWTQGGGNPYSISYEIIATGRERTYLGTAGYAKLRKVTRWVNQRTGIPLRPGRISGCAPSRSGTVQHADGRSCWGGHHDIGPFRLASILAKIHGTECNKTCDRRRKHKSAHVEVRRRNCAPINKTKSQRCILLQRRLHALHKAGVKF